MSALVVSLQPYRYATRTRKAAVSLSGERSVKFLSLEGIGRSGTWDRPLNEVIDGIEVMQLEVPRTIQSSRIASHVRNLIHVYLRGFVRLRREALRSPADVVFVTSSVLAPIARAHSRKFGSKVVVDINERPGSRPPRSSLSSYFADVESLILRRLGEWADVVTVVAPGHAEILETEYRMTNVHVVRNCPQESWVDRATVASAAGPSQGAPSRSVVVGSLVEGRALDVLLRGVAAFSSSTPGAVVLDIYGRGPSEVVVAIESRVKDLGLTDVVKVLGSVAPENVSAIYSRASFSFVLYDREVAASDSLSNKILESAASGCPVLAGNLPENVRFISKHPIGVTCDVTPDGIADGIRSILEWNKDLRNLTSLRRLSTSLTWENEFKPILDILR